MRISRRMWLAGGVAALGTAGGAAAAGAHLWRRLTHPAAGDLARLIWHRLGHLPLDPAGVDAFADEYARRYGMAPARVHHERTLGGLLRHDSMLAYLPEERRQAIVDFERGLVSRYLLSTTYFRAPAGETVRYIGFADPYEMVCTNPLARLRGRDCRG